MSTSKIPSHEVGVPEDAFSGDFIEIKTSGALYAGEEINYAAKWAIKNDYKYVIILDKQVSKELTSYTASNDYWTNDITVTPNSRRFNRRQLCNSAGCSYRANSRSCSNCQEERRKKK